jgi:catechol 2,3-dioxygenase-like lactoylglutathione lyase family enzyme
MRACLCILALVGLAGCAATGGKVSEFSRPVVDVGIVVSDVENAAAFYKDALGFTEVTGFDVPAAMGADSGLTDGKSFRVRVMKLEDSANATSVKLMQFSDAVPARQNNNFIHSTLGFRYLTIYVTDTTAAVGRAKKAGATVLAKGPYLLPEGFPKSVYLTCVRDPDGNMIELVGPKK